MSKVILPSWVPKEPVTCTLTPYEIACIGWWYSAASWESKAAWDKEEIEIFAKLGVTREPE